ncbi:MAG: sodium:calcium antiporter [Chloroflexi bacterium CFX4]|nr:sodium:calcium antiporter [Chloroflexi bacterium CFX4]MDL1921455.1 calcium/sodium antiporter [Chloroflexi bacterium CFX3]
MFQDVIWIAVGLAGLFFGGNWLVQGAARFAKTLGVSPIVIGLTIVAYGTSMPELLVSVQAALGGNADISMGNVVGSNIANIGLIIGISALIFPMVVQLQFLRREIPIMIGVSLLLLFLAQDGVLQATDGLLFVMGAVGFSVFSYLLAKREEAELIKETTEFTATLVEPPKSILSDLALIGGGIAVLLVGSERLVFGAVNIATALGVPQLVIGITLVAVGTSLPELATSVIAAFKKESEIAIGNVVGSNIFNILGILGITSLITPINVNPQLIRVDMFIMIGFSVALYLFCIGRKINRLEGLLLLVGYVAFTVYAFVPR